MKKKHWDFVSLKYCLFLFPLENFIISLILADRNDIPNLNDFNYIQYDDTMCFLNLNVKTGEILMADFNYTCTW